MRSRRVPGVPRLLLACTLVLGACSASPETIGAADLTDTEVSTDVAEQGGVSLADESDAPEEVRDPGPELLGCGVGLDLELLADTEVTTSLSEDGFAADAIPGFDAVSWVIADPSDPDGPWFQVWSLAGELGEEVVFAEAVGDFAYEHYGDDESERDDRAHFNGIAGRWADENVGVVVLTLNGSTQDTISFLASIGDVLNGAESVGNLSVVKAGVPGAVLEAAEVAETFEWREGGTRIRAQHVCGPAVGEGELELADAVALSLVFGATRTWVTGDESITPVSIGDTTGYLLDIDGGSNDDYLVGVLGSAERAIVFTIIDSGADRELGLSIVGRLSLEPK